MYAFAMCPPTECALEDEAYEDGAETQVECNRCVCACGNWVCTAMTCTGMLKPLGKTYHWLSASHRGHMAPYCQLPHKHF